VRLSWEGCIGGLPHLQIPITTHTKASEVLNMAANILKLSSTDMQGLSLFVTLPNLLPHYTAWRSISGNAMVTEVWKISEKYYTNPGHKHDVSPLIYLRRKMVMGDWPNMDIPKLTTLTYLETEQAAGEVFTGKIPATIPQIVRFASLYLQATAGDMAPVNYIDDKNVEKFVQFQGIVSGMYNQIAKEINLGHAGLSGKNTLQLLYELLLLARQWPYYGSTLFRVDVCHDKSKPSKSTTMWLGVNQKGLDLFSYPTLQAIKSWPFQSIANWNWDEREFNFVAGSLLKPSKEQFLTPEASEIALLVQDYTALLASPKKTEASKISRLSTHQDTAPTPSRRQVIIPTNSFRKRDSRILPTKNYSSSKVVAILEGNPIPSRKPTNAPVYPN